MIRTIGMIGAGNMGSAILRGIVEAEYVRASQIIAFDTNRKRMRELEEDLPGVITAGAAQTMVNLRHVRPGKRAVVFPDNQLRHSAHHPGIAGNLMLVGKALVQDEVVVAFEGMTVDASIVVAVFSNEFL